MKQNFDTLIMILAKAKEYWPEFLSKHAVHLDGRIGLYVAVADLSGYNTMGIVVGSIPSSKKAQKMQFAYEKIGRLATGDPHVCTSFATQNVAENKYGGGIKTYNVIAAGSGLPPEMDHTFILDILEQTGHCGYMAVQTIQKEFEKYKNH